MSALGPFLLSLGRFLRSHWARKLQGMADGPNLRSKPTGQLYLPCPISELELELGQFLRATTYMLLRAYAIAIPYVCLSVCLSHG